MTAFYPDSVGSVGTDLWLFVPALASKTAMTTTEAGATGSCQVSGAMRSGFGPTPSTDKFVDQRQGSDVIYEQVGATTISFPDMIVVDRPQDAANAATRKHLDVLTAGAVGFLINRRGLGSGAANYVAPASAQKYIGYPVKVAAQTPTTSDSKMHERTVSFGVTGPMFEGSIA